MRKRKGLSSAKERTPGSLFEVVSLVEHQECVQIGDTVEQVSAWFKLHPHEFAAVLDGHTYVGLVSRGQLGFLLGTRFGFTLYSRHPIQEHLLPEGMIASPSIPLFDLLEQALARSGEAFYQDVPLVDQEGCFLGIIPVPSLVRAQSTLIAQQFHLAESQRSELQSKNQDLFRSLNQLRQSQGRYETLFQQSPLAVALLNPDGQVEACNPKFQSLLGPGGASEEPPPNLAGLMPVRQRESFLELLSLHDSGSALPGNHVNEFSLQLPGLGERLFKLHTSLVHETGQICTILHDITEQRAVERKLAISDKAALFESLVGGVAHELNNKLSPVLGFSELLTMRLEGVDGQDSLKSYCNAISRSAQESVRIIRQLLQLSRPPTMELSPTDLGAVVREAASIMRFRLRSAEASLKLDLPSGAVTVLADSAQIKQVIINLMINAVDAIEHAGSKDIVVQAGAQEAWGYVSVRDRGYGIAPDKLNRIFDPFYTTKTAERGTGLGLSVCLGILRQHGGEITVKSAPGEGSVFRVQLPLAPSEAKLAGAAASSLPAAAPPHDTRPGLDQVPRLDVLVIDDEEYITNLVQELLRTRLGWRVERVHDGRQGIQRLEQGGFDLVITDLRMPGLDGFAVLGWIRDFRPALLSSVLVITGDTGSQEMDQELLGFGVPTLQKPFTPEALVEACRKVLVGV